MKPPITLMSNGDDASLVSLIRESADRHGVPRQVALAFAWCESRLRADCQGDLDWHERMGGDLYKRHVMGNARLKFNPWRQQPALWHSYGLFQLMACYFTAPAEDPRALLDPRINAERGCAEIRRLLVLTKDDVRAARLAYVGCGPSGSQCAAVVRDSYLVKLSSALQRYSAEANA
jgi:hypothetical protein